MEYYSDKEVGPKPRKEEKISPTAWGGIVALIQSLISTGAFGYSYPEICQEGTVTVGTDVHAFSLALKAEIPDIEWPFETSKRVVGGYPQLKEPYAPNTLSILDLIQFSYKAVANPIQGKYHDYHSHYHLSFDEQAGKRDFIIKINSIFSRNGIVYQLNPGGSIERLAPPVIRETLAKSIFNTGDLTLDEMLEDSRKKFFDPDPIIRKEAIERLWDCWERIKTLEIPADKKASTKSLLDKAATNSDVRELLEKEAKELTDIGNSFHIRHSEVSKTAITDSDFIDYLFHRLFSIIQYLLKKR